MRRVACSTCVILKIIWVKFGYLFVLSTISNLTNLSSIPVNGCSRLLLGAIQIIRDTLGGRGASKNVTGQFLLVISLVKVDKICHMGGGGWSKKCGKSVTYYLNGPLCLIIIQKV